MDNKPLVWIVMGSDSDYPVMKEAAKTLTSFGIPFQLNVSSAHRTPERTAQLAHEVKQAGAKVIIAAAGGAAHLAGAVAAHSDLPVIGVPLSATDLGGLDALLSTVQMPPGVPVACMGVGTWGAINAALFATQILARSDEALADAYLEYRKKQQAKVLAREEKVLARLAEDA